MTYIIRYKLKGFFQNIHTRKCQDFSYRITDDMYIFLFKGIVSKNKRMNGKDVTLNIPKDVLEGFSEIKL